MSRDDGMDEHGIDWLLGCHLVGFGLKSWANLHVPNRTESEKYVFKILAGAQQFKSARYSFCTVGVW
jgi:hypothetical protein